MGLCGGPTWGEDSARLHWFAAALQDRFSADRLSIGHATKGGQPDFAAATLNQHPVRHSHGCQSMRAGCPTLLATHFQKLEALPEVYPNCRLHHFKVHAAGSSLNFTRELLPGQQQNLHYGLLLAEAMAMDQGVSQGSLRLLHCILSCCSAGQQQRTLHCEVLISNGKALKKAMGCRLMHA